MEPIREALLRIDDNLDVEIWPDVEKPERVQLAVAWNQAKHIFESYPNLKVISSMGAGADHLLNDPTIPNHIRFTKIYDPSMVTQMSDYVHSCILSIFLKLTHYRKAGSWFPQPKYTREDLVIGLMGLGNIGRETAIYLASHGYTVLGLSRSEKKITDIQTYTSEEMNSFLKNVHILVNLLPLTGETEGILNLELFKKLKSPSFIINTARGDHMVDEDLIYALDIHLIDSAYLDVFSEEPLPDSHPFWNRENIFITPHIAAISDPDNVATAVVENYKRLLSGMELLHKIENDS